MDLSAYLYSLAVITCGSNVKGTKVRKGDYLYCAVLETHEVSWAEMGEVSIFAAWKVLGIKNKEHIGNSFPDNRGGKWKIDIFEKSMPKGNWATNDKKLRKQIYKHGRKCYRGKGKCLNPKK